MNKTKILSFFNNLKKIPNLITFSRIILVPFLFYFAYTQEKYIFVILFLTAGLTDILDGYFARRLNQTSLFGARLDSIADDVILLSLVFWLYWLLPEFLIKNWYLFVLIYLTFLISLYIQYILSTKKTGLHLWSAKFSFFMIFVVITLFVLYKPYEWMLYLLTFLILSTIIETSIKLLKNKKPDTTSFFAAFSKNKKN